MDARAHPVSGSRARDDEIARLRDKIVELERQLQAARAPSDGEPPGALHAEIVRQQRQAEELGRIARLVNESLDLRTVSERLAEGVLSLLDVHSSAIRLLQPDGSLTALALGGRAKEHAANGEAVPAGVGLVGRAAAEGHAMWTEDIRCDARFERNPKISERNAALGIVAGLAVPLRVTGRVTGVVSVGSPTPRAFTAPAKRPIASSSTRTRTRRSGCDNCRVNGSIARMRSRLSASIGSSSPRSSGGWPAASP